MNTKLLKEYVKIIVEQETSSKQKITVGDIKSTLDILSTPESELDKKLKDKNFIKNVAKGAGRVIISATGGPAIDASIELAKIVSDKIKFKNHLKKFKQKFNIKNKDSDEKQLADMYGVNSKKGFKMLSVPEEMSKLIDDRVEAKFILYLKKYIDSKPPEEEVDVIALLKAFTKKELEGYYVTK